MNYNFPGEAFSKPSSGKVHTCSIFDVSVNRKDSVNNVVRNPSVKQWFDTESRNATTASLDRFLKGIGIDIPYRSVLRTLGALKNASFVSETEQYRLLDNYVQVLNDKE